MGLEYKEVSARQNINITETFIDLANQLPDHNPYKLHKTEKLEANKEEKVSTDYTNCC